MTKVNVKGNVWDIKSIDGNTVTFVNGQTTTVSDKTAAGIEKALKPKRRLRRNS